MITRRNFVLSAGAALPALHGCTGGGDDPEYAQALRETWRHSVNTERAGTPLQRDAQSADRSAVNSTAARDVARPRCTASRSGGPIWPRPTHAAIAAQAS
jgi:hypothetical protein